MSDSLLYSPQAFENYIQGIHSRLEQIRFQKLVPFWQQATEQVEIELKIAQELEQEDIVAELTELQVSLFELLARYEVKPIGIEFEPQESALPTTIPTTTPLEESSASLIEQRIAVPEPLSTKQEWDEEEPEKDVKQQLDQIEQAWNELLPKKFISNTGNWKRANLLRLRALASRLHALNTLDESHEYKDSLLFVIAQMDDARLQANENCYSVPFVSDYFAESDTALTYDQWETLANDYERVAKSYEAWEWYEQHIQIEDTVAKNLLDSIEAGVALLRESLLEYTHEPHNRDIHQFYLFKNLVELTKDKKWFLHSLDPNYPIEHLEGLANKLDEKLLKAQENFQQLKQERDNAYTKEEIVKELLNILESRADFGRSESCLEADRAQLYRALDRCVEHSIPASNKEIRERLSPLRGLLVGQDKYRVFLREIDNVLKRQASIVSSEAPPEVEDIQDVQKVMQVAFLKAYIRGKRILLLGGTPRPATVATLSKDLEGAEVDWRESDKNDPVDRFKGDIGRVDILIVLQEFVRHEMNDKGKEWIEGKGGHYIAVPKGYGAQMIRKVLFQHFQRINSQFAHFWSEIKDLNKASFCGYSLPHEDTKL